MTNIDKAYQRSLDTTRLIQQEVTMQKPYLATQEVASILGISKQTLLRYEKKKIVPKPRRNPINKRREYSLEDLAKLKKITGRF
jgi:hypothetical protein